MSAALTQHFSSSEHSGLPKGGESLGPPAEAHSRSIIRPVTDNEFSLGPDWLLELTDPVVRRIAGLLLILVWA